MPFELRCRAPCPLARQTLSHRLKAGLDLSSDGANPKIDSLVDVSIRRVVLAQRVADELLGKGDTIQARYFDGNYSNNSGAMKLDIYAPGS
jgi:hypothetical protein